VPTDSQRVSQDDSGRLALAADLSRYALMVLSLYFVATFVIAAIVRMAHPYELDWLEGSVVDHVARVVAGKPIYVEPSISFVPHTDTPIYYWTSGLFAAVLGVGFLPLRLVSFLASVGCLSVLYLWVERETKDRFAGLAAAGFYAATYPIVAESFDMGRTDALGLFFLLLGAYWLRGAKTVRDHFVAAVWMAAAVFTRQSALIVLGPLCLYCLISLRGRLRFVFPVASIGLIGLATAVGSRASDGWLFHYVLRVPLGQFTNGFPQQEAIVDRSLLDFWTHDLAATLPVPVLLAAGCLVAIAAARRSADTTFHLMLAAGLLGASWAQRPQLAGYGNVLMPAYALIALLAGQAMQRLPAWAGSSRGDDGSAAAARARFTALGIHLLCVVQLSALYYDPGEVIPDQADRDEGARLVAMMEQIDGEILSPIHGHLPSLAGKETSAHIVAIGYVTRAGGPVGAALETEVRRVLGEGRYAAIFGPMAGFSLPLRDNYSLTGMGSPSADVEYPRGSSSGRSRDVYLRRAQ